MEQDFFDIPEALWRQISWYNRFRGLPIRRKRRSDNYLAMLQLVYAIIAFQQDHGS